MKTTLILILTFAFLSANAQIIYTDNGSAIVGNNQLSEHTIDFNQDNNPDMNIFWNELDFAVAMYHADNEDVELICETVVGTFLGVSLRKVIPLEYGDPIDASQNYLAPEEPDSPSDPGGRNNLWIHFSMEGIEFPEEDKYLGVEFLINGQAHYGWVRASRPPGSTSVEFKDFAYQSDINQSIFAGQLPATVGLDVQKELSTWSIFPNPAVDKLIINKEDSSTEEFSILNAMGLEIRNFSFSGNDLVELDIQDLVPGIYFIRNGQNDLKKFIKL